MSYWGVEIQRVVDILILVMAGILALFTLLLLFMHFVANARSRRMRRIREQLLCLINAEKRAERMRGQLLSLIDEAGELTRISQVRGICSMRGMQVMEQLIHDLTPEQLQLLQRAVQDPWYLKYVDSVLNSHRRDRVILCVKLAGELHIGGYNQQIVEQLYFFRENGDMQGVALLALSLLGDGERLLLVLEDKGLKLLLSFRSIQEIVAAYTGDGPALYGRLAHTAADPYIRRACIKRIGNLGLASLAPEVTPYLKNESLNLRMDAIRALGQLRYLPAWEAVADQAGDQRWQVRSVVMTALGAMDLGKSVPVLLKGLCDKEWWVRYRAAEALSKRPKPQELTPLVEGLGDRFAKEMFAFALGVRALADGAGEVGGHA